MKWFILLISLFALCAHSNAQGNPFLDQLAAVIGNRDNANSPIGFIASMASDFFNGAAATAAQAPGYAANLVFGNLLVVRHVWILVLAAWDILQRLLWLLYWPVVFPAVTIMEFLTSMFEFGTF